MSSSRINVTPTPRRRPATGGGFTDRSRRIAIRLPASEPQVVPLDDRQRKAKPWSVSRFTCHKLDPSGFEGGLHTLKCANSDSLILLDAENSPFPDTRPLCEFGLRHAQGGPGGSQDFVGNDHFSERRRSGRDTHSTTGSPTPQIDVIGAINWRYGRRFADAVCIAPLIPANQRIRTHRILDRSMEAPACCFLAAKRSPTKR